MNDDEDADLQRALEMSLAHGLNSRQLRGVDDDEEEEDDNDDDDDDDEDAALAAALQLSLQKEDNEDKFVGAGSDGQSMVLVSSPADDSPSIPTKPLEPIPTPDPEQWNSRVRLWFQTATPTNILDCHYIIWDITTDGNYHHGGGGATTQNDQKRWLAQSIAFKSQTTPTNSGKKMDIHPAAQETVLGAIICHSELWGLTQEHGGPCGVLASIQAELMRLLLFGPRCSEPGSSTDISAATKTSAAKTGIASTINNGPQISEESVGANSKTTATSNASGSAAPVDVAASTSSSSFDSSLPLLPVHIPTQLTNHFCKAPPDLSAPFLRSALALSIGIVLARAALQPSASQNDDDTTNTTATMNPTTSIEDKKDLPSYSSAFSRPAIAKLVFPNPMVVGNPSEMCQHLEWYHFEPWMSNDSSSSTKFNAGGLSDYLVTYTISLDESSSSVMAAFSNEKNSTETVDSESSKRQKRGNFSTPEEQEELLAQAVAEFLLQTNAIEWYHRQGGVLLFVLALVESRGVANIQADMDDPTARLTSQFGHCSQELINLLLTGQAVSNVFDNTLRPSGELICRGIQRRPVIGYLSQLESMRYLEVGGYYKQPQFPIWVVGSTSHFTILFGDATCLKESPSDRILEKVRRAFKQMDGGEEQGFIQLNQLGDFLRKLDLYDKLGDHGVQMLGATIEVPGAGILLWEDVWKRVSRLLTGASLESVLNIDDRPSNNDKTGTTGGILSSVDATTSGPPPLEPATTGDGPLSDEDYARALQAEWNREKIFPSPAPAPPPDTARAKNNNSQDKDTFGTTFQLYHYNGLRGGYMKPFRVTRLSAEEAIGTSVTLGANYAPTSRAMGGTGTQDGGLEEVLRTKWPSCKVDWLNGGMPPSID